MLLGEFDHLFVDLDLGEAFDLLVLEHFLGDAAIAAADDEDVLGIAVGEQWHVRHHFLVDEFVPLGDLGGAIEHEHFAEIGLLEQDQVLVVGLQFIEHPVDLKAHAEAEIVEQGFRNPALLWQFFHDGPGDRANPKRQVAATRPGHSNFVNRESGSGVFAAQDLVDADAFR